MNLENPTSTSEKSVSPKIEIEKRYVDFVPDEFKTDPFGYFEIKGVNSSLDGAAKTESDKVTKSPITIKDLPNWSDENHRMLEIVGKCGIVKKEVIGTKNDPFYEYQILEIAAEFVLQSPRPIVKVMTGDKHLIVTEKVQGIVLNEQGMKKLAKIGFSEMDRISLLKRVYKKIKKMKAEFDFIGLHRTWELGDMVCDVNLEKKKLLSLDAINWNNTEIDFKKLEKERAKIHEAKRKLHHQLKECILLHLDKAKELYAEELESIGTSDPDMIADLYIERMLTEEPANAYWQDLIHYTNIIHPYSDIIKDALVYPAFFMDSYDNWKQGKNIFKDEKTVLSYAHNHTRRSNEKIEDQPMRMEKRLEQDPFAQADEFNAGVYREELEPQVSDAVFLMRKKGYSTIQSGFDDLLDGSQFIDFNKEGFENESIGVREILESEVIKDFLQNAGVKAKIKEFSDRLTFKLIPNDSLMSLGQWKNIFDTLAMLMPDRGHIASPPVLLGSYGSFMEQQRKMREGDEINLGYGMTFDGQKAVKIKNVSKVT